MKVYVYRLQNTDVLTYSLRADAAQINELMRGKHIVENITDKLRIHYRNDESISESSLSAWRVENGKTLKCYAGTIIFEAVDENGNSRDIDQYDILYILDHFKPYG